VEIWKLPYQGERIFHGGAPAQASAGLAELEKGLTAPKLKAWIG